ncbi:MAG: DUF2934 domain-containing protein [Gammaproteobacteria bacterium]|uniref:DUF2934 domain-containing protein n=1 Tax=Rhodoferax sp. TaxID=50421 RepID=UPI0017BB828F|nr:DUF2934 domain-containing protein [Rhodoferax sp.]MBU3900923.1 DUF2934 domain-containing protein [Gammaproteobacteria bacterium]MBA3057457.1 DUF2934 domain-containing protein [Rhodoferax sp.]MBU3996848.1 DUF2934 domain-containing protein [Gammaproteobacteria bacterium]MBU4017597.1 DUF2934 domain-containing protein [Gammaproteobacteria bacterium]MBU4081040.1 DUF2934 domain-containing protein [Gammaproteobacteria bacterium]
MKHPQTTHHAAADVAGKKKPTRSGKKGNGDDQNAVDLSARAGDSGRDEIVRQTAYSLYEARGYVGGYDLDDWLQAEAKMAQVSAREMGS